MNDELEHVVTLGLDEVGFDLVELRLIEACPLIAKPCDNLFVYIRGH